MSKINIAVGVGLKVSQETVNSTKRDIQARLQSANITAPLRLSWTKKELNKIVSEINQYTLQNKGIKIPVSFTYTKKDVNKYIRDIRKTLQQEAGFNVTLGLDIEKSKAKIQQQLARVIAGVTKKMVVDISPSSKSTTNSTTTETTTPTTSAVYNTQNARGNLDKLKADFDELNISSKTVSSQLSQLDILLDKIEHSNSFQEQKEHVSQFESTLKKVQNSITQLQSTQEQRVFDFNIVKKSLESDIAIFESKYPSAVRKSSKEIQEFKDRLNGLDDGDIEGVKTQRREWNTFTKELRANGELTENLFKRLFNNAKKFMQWYGVTGFLSDVVRLMRAMVGEVKAVDTAMVNLKKVTDASDSTFNRFLDNAYSKAKKLGVAVTDLIAAVTEFSRVGFNLEESTVLGEAAVLYKNVGDGITAEEASKSIISTMKAFDIEALDVTQGIVDKLNEVGNNFAISSVGLGDALQRSAAALNAGNNSLDESIALITAANAIAQNPESVGNAMKVVAARIRGAKAELEEMGEETDGVVESTSKLQAQLIAMTGVDIMEADGQTFKSTYQILDEISQVWDSLTDVSRASVLETLAGKLRSSVVAGLISNFDEAREVLETSMDAAGSAAEEQARWLGSIEGRLKTLKTGFQDLSNTIFDSDWFKTGVSLLTKILDLVTGIIDKLGGLPVILGAIGAKALNVGGHKITCPFTHCRLICV